MAKGNFGERLKREREMREVSLAEVTSGTRIGQRFLEALENEEWDKLPGGIFSRGFVRSIARYLGLNEEDLLSEFDLARGVQKMDAPAPYENRLPSPPKWIPAIALLTLVALVVGFIYAGRYGWRRYAEYRSTHSSATVNTLAPAVPPRQLTSSNSLSRPPYRRMCDSGRQPSFTRRRRDARRHSPFLRRAGIPNQRSGRLRSASGAERTANHFAGRAWKLVAKLGYNRSWI